MLKGSISAAGSKIHSHSLEPSKWGNGEHMTELTNVKATLVRSRGYGYVRLKYYVSKYKR